MIRSIERTDLDELEQIHSKFFKEQFDLPDFFKKYLCAFTVEDKCGIISIGGVRTIIEAVMVTNKDRSPIDRMMAIYQMLDAGKHVTRMNGYDQIYSFHQDPKWYKRLSRMGFRPPQGQPLLLDL